MDSAVLTVLPTLVSKVAASPATFYPLVDDGYRDKAEISFSLAADTDDTTLRIYRADTYGRCCGAEVQTVDFGPLGHGSYNWTWDGIKSDFSPAGKGTYFVRIDATDTGAVSMTSKALKVTVPMATIRRSATKTKNGALYARVGSPHATASGGNCAVWRSPPNAGVLCANAEVTVYYRWGLKPNERVKSVSFKVDHGYYVCTHKLGHTPPSRSSRCTRRRAPRAPSCRRRSSTPIRTRPEPAAQPRPIHVATSASFPSGSASVHHAGRERVVDEPAPGRQRRRDSRLRLIVWDPDVEMDSVALRPRRVHVLEPDRRTAGSGIDQILVTNLLVAEQRLPKGHHVGTDQRVDGELDGLQHRRIRSRPSPRAAPEISRANDTSRSLRPSTSCVIIRTITPP